MLNFCIFVFVFYALFAIVRMLFTYGIANSFGSIKRERRRTRYEKNRAGFGVTSPKRTDKAYF